MFTTLANSLWNTANRMKKPSPGLTVRGQSHVAAVQNLNLMGDQRTAQQRAATRWSQQKKSFWVGTNLKFMLFRHKVINQKSLMVFQNVQIRFDTSDLKG